MKRAWGGQKERQGRVGINWEAISPYSVPEKWKKTSEAKDIKRKIM